VRKFYSEEQIATILRYFPGDPATKDDYLRRALGSSSLLWVALNQFNRPDKAIRQKRLDKVHRAATKLQVALRELDHDSALLLSELALDDRYSRHPDLGPYRPANVSSIDGLRYGVHRLLRWCRKAAKFDPKAQDARQWRDSLEQPAQELARLWRDIQGEQWTHYWCETQEDYSGEFRYFLIAVLGPVASALNFNIDTLTRWLKTLPKP
jgi:hypothetical protein